MVERGNICEYPVFKACPTREEGKDGCKCTGEGASKTCERNIALTSFTVLGGRGKEIDGDNYKCSIYYPEFVNSEDCNPLNDLFSCKDNSGQATGEVRVTSYDSGGPTVSGKENRN